MVGVLGIGTVVFLGIVSTDNPNPPSNSYLIVTTFNSYLATKANNNHNKIKVVLKGKDKAYVFGTEKLYRSDVMRANGSRIGLSLIGFESVILKECLPKDTYQIGVAIGKQYVMSDKEQKM